MLSVWEKKSLLREERKIEKDGKERKNIYIERYLSWSVFGGGGRESRLKGGKWGDKSDQRV